MNWLIIISNIAFASISALLCVLGWSTLKTIKYLNVGKTFWIPVFLSGLLFSISSTITILNDAVLALTTAVEIAQITQLIALCALSIGIYSYSKTIRKNIPEKYIVPKANSAQNDKLESYISSTHCSDKSTVTSNNMRTEIASGCNHEIGYLRTFPTNASLPEECLSCNKVMECKKS
jgi:hypothetical protein